MNGCIKGKNIRPIVLNGQKPAIKERYAALKF